jgi:hypothetical protein
MLEGTGGILTLLLIEILGAVLAGAALAAVLYAMGARRAMRRADEDLAEIRYELMALRRMVEELSAEADAPEAGGSNNDQGSGSPPVVGVAPGSSRSTRGPSGFVISI